MINLFNYLDRPSPIHRLAGATKLVCTLLWTLSAMITYDTRLLAVMPAAAILLFVISKIRLRDVKFMLGLTFVFMVLNNLTVFLFAPFHGCEIYGSRTDLFHLFGPYTVTKEQLFYHLNLVLKYLAQIPLILLFFCTTEPSEFAASLNKIGVSYRIAYAIALTLRYIPDIQREYEDISMAQQARGVELSKKESLTKRLKSAGAILTPLILSSMDRIEVISNAMELRGFGKLKKRSWYRARPFGKGDYLSMGLCVLLLIFTIADIVMMGSRFYNPFV